MKLKRSCFQWRHTCIFRAPWLGFVVVGFVVVGLVRAFGSFMQQGDVIVSVVHEVA